MDIDATRAKLDKLFQSMDANREYITNTQISENGGDDQRTHAQVLQVLRSIGDEVILPNSGIFAESRCCPIISPQPFQFYWVSQQKAIDYWHDYWLESGLIRKFVTKILNPSQEFPFNG